MGDSRGYSMGNGGGGGILFLMALVACIPLGCHLSDEGQQSGGGAITLERQRLVFKFDENGSTFSLNVDFNITVRDLYDVIYDYEGVPGDYLKLRLDDIELRHQDAKLFECNIRDGTTISLVLPEREYRKTATFIVITLDGREMYVESQLSKSVSSVKDTITQLTGIPRAEQRLVFKGKLLKDERKLAEYGIKNGVKINLGRPLNDCNQTVTVRVKALGGALFELEVNLADTVADVKEKIATRTGIPADVQQILMSDSRAINANDHLCDLGLEAGAFVFMYLYTPRITSPDQVARLEGPPPHRAPIFRESGDEASMSLFRDTRNWIARPGPGLGSSLTQFNPVAYLDPNPDNEGSITVAERTAERLARTGTEESDRLEVDILRARIKLSLALRPYRVAANLTWGTQYNRRQPGISLAGGLADGSSNPEQPVPLGADVNNWAPDAFADSDIMRLFEVGERVRQVLARGAGTGEAIGLSIDSQRRINHVILRTYHEALAGFPRSNEYNQTVAGKEECRVCRDDLAAEPAVKLACVHAFHSDCILQWVASSYRGQSYPSCPYCGQRFMFAYEALGKAELEAPELQVNQGDK